MDVLRVFVRVFLLFFCFVDFVWMCVDVLLILLWFSCGFVCEFSYMFYGCVWFCVDFVWMCCGFCVDLGGFVFVVCGIVVVLLWIC